MERRIDLHVHTTASDGTLTPRQTVKLAHELGLAAIAVTDHDTVSGLAEARAAGTELGVEVIPGVELAAEYRGREAHILGLFIDPNSSALRPALDWGVQERERRNSRIVSAMRKDGFDISMQALKAAHPGAVLGRPHIAGWLMGRGYASSVKDAFDRYLGKGRPYYSPRTWLPLSRAVGAIRGAGGVAVIAHPLQYGFDREAWETFIRAAMDAGCTAMEAYYSQHSPAQQQELLRTAARYGLAVSGGSDFHGAHKSNIQMGSGIGGSLAVPYSVLEKLRP